MGLTSDPIGLTSDLMGLTSDPIEEPPLWARGGGGCDFGGGGGVGGGVVAPYGELGGVSVSQRGIRAPNGGQ